MRIGPGERSLRQRSPFNNLIQVPEQAVLGLAVGYGAAAWNYSDQIDRLENQTQLMTQVPLGGFSSEYGAAREHLAQAEIVAARTPLTFTNEYSAPREHLVLAEIMEART